jgi:hypothetical protein
VVFSCRRLGFVVAIEAMKTPPLADLSRNVVIGLALILTAGCATHKETPPPAPAPVHKHCPAKFSYHYVDSPHGFSLCLPKHLTKGDASSYGYPAGSALFTGFSVPAGTNLVTKKLIIVSGTDSDIQGATAWGHFSADGVTFTRQKALDGSAGHMTTYISYGWTHGGKVLHFDFQLFASNPAVFPPATRPAEYSLNAQLKYSEEIMSTFHRLH